MSAEHQQFDICVIGAGMVGAASACALADLGLKVAVVEPFLPEKFDPRQTPDLRVSALNKHSIDLLTQLHAIDNIKQMRFRPYDRLLVWEDELAKTTFSAQDIGEQQLGMFVENRIIQLALLDSIEHQYAQHIKVFSDKATSIDTRSGDVILESEHAILARLIVGADGANSQVRNSAAIGQTGWDYAQRANLILVQMRQHIPNTTWQQFTPTGPLALLPMHDNYACLVWYASAEVSAHIQGMDKCDLKDAIVHAFPSLLDEFEVCERAGFGLTRMHANQYWRNKAVLVGDAAHTINPLAGQGVNLGFKDVSALVASIKQHGIDDLSKSLSEYEKKRRVQNLAMMTVMDALYATFSNDVMPLKMIRNLALSTAQRAGPLKNMALKYAMGI
jgi:2-octaprenyl-3-methyl-6-methoxy-1,4-benzoquinol hydroxylase